MHFYILAETPRYIGSVLAVIAVQIVDIPGVFAVHRFVFQNAMLMAGYNK